jgi:hypothetical protein
MEKSFKLLFKNLCCSKCKNDFDEDSIKSVHKEKDYNVIHLVCSKCGKDFGLAFLKLSDNISDNENDIELKDSRNKPPITSNEVIDAHEYIKDFENNWKKFIDD